MKPQVFRKAAQHNIPKSSNSLHNDSSDSLLRSRQLLYVPMRGGVMLKDKDDPEKTVGASLRGTTIHVHWTDGFTPGEVKRALKPWWPLATEMEFPK